MANALLHSSLFRLPTLPSFSPNILFISPKKNGFLAPPTFHKFFHQGKYETRGCTHRVLLIANLEETSSFRKDQPQNTPVTLIWLVLCKYFYQ
jgi:hypothetical protein